MVGQSILHYNILEKLGEGGMGIVYLAEDTKLKRNVAVKFLPNYILSNEEERKRFEIEAQAAASLNHPNICTIYSIEEADDNVFIVMEYIEGKELKDIVVAGLPGKSGQAAPSLQIKDVINYAIQIAEGLEAAHKKEIVHRDIKSQNIMITTGGKVKIMDFGLAKIEAGVQVAKTGSTAGTAAYMSPEQAGGDELDHRTDIWSFGVVLYEMLTGKVPFKGDYEQALIYSIINEEHHPVSELRPDVLPAFSKIIDLCLEKDPHARFQNMESIIEELKLLAKKKKKDLPADNLVSIAVLPFADISPEYNNQYFSDGLTEEIITRLSKLKGARVISRASVMNYQRAGKDMMQIAAELGVSYVLEGSVRKNASDLRISTQLIDAKQDIYLWADKYSGTMDDIFEIQENVAEKITKALKVHLSPVEKKNLKQRWTHKTDAYQLYLKGRFFWNKRTQEGLQLAIKYFEQAIEIDSQYALAWAGIADSYNLLGEYGTIPRKETYPKAKEAVKKALKFDNNLAEAHTSLASLLMLHEWDWKNSFHEFQTAIKLNPNYSTAHHWFAEWFLFNGRFDEAIKEISVAVELEPLSPAILKDKGMAFYYARRYDDAIEFAGKALELDPEFGSAHRLLSLAYQEKGLLNEAIKENQLWNDFTHNDLDASVALARCYALAGKKEEAADLIKKIDVENLKNGNLFRTIAIVYIALGRKESAIKYLKKAVGEKAESMCMIKIDPKLEPVHNEPRFKLLLEKIGLK
ncbi:MAG TPA: protein kinase [Ignavibacteriaceae bacterium]|nr:protein kinase [Ignavibacteriaceae bacterium]